MKLRHPPFQLFGADLLLQLVGFVVRVRLQTPANGCQKDSSYISVHRWLPFHGQTQLSLMANRKAKRASAFYSSIVTAKDPLTLGA